MYHTPSFQPTLHTNPPLRRPRITDTRTLQPLITYPLPNLHRLSPTPFLLEQLTPPTGIRPNRPRPLLYISEAVAPFRTGRCWVGAPPAVAHVVVAVAEEDAAVFCDGGLAVLGTVGACGVGEGGGEGGGQG